MSDYEDLVLRYNEKMSERERAKLESMIWALIPKAERPKSGIAQYIHGALGAQYTYVACRQLLYNASPVSDTLWNRVEEGMALNTAAKILRESRNSLDTHASAGQLAETIAARLREYDGKGFEAKSISGVSFRKNNPVRTRPEQSQEYKSRDPDFWGALKTLVRGYVSTRLEDVDEIEAEKVCSQFEADLKVVLLDFQWNLSKNRRAAKSSARAIGRHAMLNACDVLGVNHPKPGESPDMEQAKKQRKSHARAYHPDKSGSEETRPQFESAMEAFRTLELYAELNRSHPKSKSVNGGSSGGEANVDE